MVVGVHTAGELTAAARRIDQAAKGALKKRRATSRARPAPRFLHSLPGVAAERVLLVGLGDKSTKEAAYRDAVRRRRTR